MRNTVLRLRNLHPGKRNIASSNSEEWIFVVMDFDFVSQSPEETIDIGRKMGSQLHGGEVFGLCGALGSGKTHLIKGISAGAGAEDYSRVNSPTFVIINEYSGRFKIYHIDAYRLDSIAEFEQLGFDDFCDRDSVVLIEWADKVESALGGIDYIRIELEHRGVSEREIHIDNVPEYIRL